jgi:sulfonate transport system substrate-binding protein
VTTPPPPISRTHPHRTALLAVLALMALLAAACSGEASTRSDDADAGPTTTAAPVTTAATIPDGVTLRVGDQLDYLSTVLAVSGQDQGLEYAVEYSTFVGGPPMLQAFQGGALDVGFVGSTPLIFAQAANQDLVAVAGWATETGLGGLITADPEIEGWGDLKGKRVAYQRGTASEATLLQALDAAGLELSDVETVDVPITQINAALAGGAADAGVSTEPLISLYLNDTPDGRVAGDANEITDRSSFLIASSDALANDGTSAAIADYLTRLVKAFDYLRENREQLAQAIFVEQYGLTPERAAELVERTGGTEFIELPGDIVPQQQKLADLFFEAGQVPVEVDVAAEFDTRFNDVVTEAKGS